MSVENAKEFLVEVLKDPKLTEMLKGVSVNDLIEATEEMGLDDIAGGGRCIGTF